MTGKKSKFLEKLWGIKGRKKLNASWQQGPVTVVEFIKIKNGIGSYHQ